MDNGSQSYSTYQRPKIIIIIIIMLLYLSSAFEVLLWLPYLGSFITCSFIHLWIGGRFILSSPFLIFLSPILGVIVKIFSSGSRHAHKMLYTEFHLISQITNIFRFWYETMQIYIHVLFTNSLCFG